MSSFIITWSPKGWDYEKLAALVEQYEASGSLTTDWRFQAINLAQPGDRVFLLKQGDGAKGIFGCGSIKGLPFRKTSSDGLTYGVADVAFERLVDPLSLLLIGEEATKRVLPPAVMRTQASGVPIEPGVAEALEDLLDGEDHQQVVGGSTSATRRSWTLLPGEAIERKKLHDLFGGSRQSGISSSIISPNVFVFSDPASGQQHGYIDSWQEDGLFHYTGEGQRGDQRLRSGNAAILKHKATGKKVRLFEGSGGLVRYVDEFEIDAERPYYMTDAPETGGGPVRSVIVFRLRPLTIAPLPPTEAAHLAKSDEVAEVAIEDQHTERMFVEPGREVYEAERREAKLVLKFRDHLIRKGCRPTRLRVLPKGEVKPLYSDLYVPEQRLLIEAKGTLERGSIRMAIGQLLDYGRFVQGARRAILLPGKPREDLLLLIQNAGIEVFWLDGDNFLHVPSGKNLTTAGHE